jgi:hypothetical protein
LLVTAVGTSLAVAHFAPKICAALAATARAIQVVIFFVVYGSSVTFEHGYSRSLDSQYDGRVCVIAEHMTPDTTIIPTERDRRVVMTINVHPSSVITADFVSILGHVGETDNRVLIRNIRTRYILGDPHG